MNDDRTLTTVDQRGRAAAAGVRTAVAERPVPAFDPDLVRIDVDARPPRGRRPVVGLLTAAAAVSVVVAAIVALAGIGVDDDSAPADRVAPGDLQRFQLGHAPDGFEVAGLSEEGVTGGEDLGRATLYGPDEAHPRLAVAVLPPHLGSECSSADGDDCEGPGGGDVPDVATGLEEVPLEEHRAWDASSLFGGGALLVEVDDDVVLVAGATLSSAERRVAAEGIVAGDPPTVAPDHLPDGVAEIATAPLRRVLGPRAGIFVVSRGAEAPWRLWYGLADPSDDRFGTISVSVTAGSAVDVGMAGIFAADLDEVTVRDVDGLLTRTDPGSGTMWTVRWQERPGEIVEVEVTTTADRDVTREEVLALAEGLVPVGDADVTQIRRAIADRGLDQPGVTVVGDGEFSDGTSWRLVHGLGDAELPRSGLTLRTDATSVGRSFRSSGASVGRAGSADEPEGLGVEVAVVDGPAYAWAFGPVTPDVTSVQVWRAGTVLAIATIVRADDLAGWVAELPPGLPDDGASDELVVVALDAAGAEIDRMET